MSKLNYGESLDVFDESDMDSLFAEYLSNLSNQVRVKENARKCLFKGKYKIFYYSSKMTPGSNIYNAVTGNIYNNYFVGNDPFFKVLVLGQHLYYDSPDEYENHFRTVLNRIIKLRWIEKMEKLDKLDKLEKGKEISQFS